MDTATLIGSTGALLLLIAFASNAFGKLNEESRIYHGLNFVGAGLLTWYSVILNSPPFIVLEGIWTVVALYELVRLAKSR